MRIGIPKETKLLEGRVGLIPAACQTLCAAGHSVFIETGAGLLSGYADGNYADVGVVILASASDLYAEAELIVKVKEPIDEDLQYLRAHHILFCFLHLAALPSLTKKLCDIGLTAIAFETLRDNSGRLPLLAPMSDIAGRLAIQLASNFLHQPSGGKGLLLGGLAGAERGKVVVIGAGVAGGSATALAAAMGAQVTVFDKKRDRLEAMRKLGNNVEALYAYPESLDQAIVEADVVVGAVLIPGARAPKVVSADQIRRMQPGSVVVDISVDQGGCIETTKPTNYQEPTYTLDGIVHLAVTNLPGAVPYTASQALSAVLTPYVSQLAAEKFESDADFFGGLNVRAGKLVLPALV